MSIDKAVGIQVPIISIAGKTKRGNQGNKATKPNMSSLTPEQEVKKKINK